MRHNLEAFAEADADPRRLVAVGGGTRGSLWTQIVSDVTGLLDGAERWNPVATVIAPDPAAAATHEPLYEVYRELYPATRAQAHALALQEEA